MKNALITLLLISTVYGVQAQNTAESLTLQFFETYKEDPMKALDELFATNIWMSKNQDGIDNLKFKLKENAALIGNYIGYEEIEKTTVGNSLKTIFFIVKYERQPLRFVFRYYKPKDKWQIQNFYFDEEL